MNNTERFLSVIMTSGRYIDICEGLGGFHNDAWTELILGSGDITMTPDGKGWIVDSCPNKAHIDTGISIVRVIQFDMDYENFLFAQVWDRRDERPTWKFVLFFNTGRNEWVPEVIAAWDERPKFAVVGAIVDDWPVS